MSDLNSQPVSLPTGSYDADVLQLHLDQAAASNPEDYAEAVDVAIASAVTVVAESTDPRVQAGYTFREVENDIGTTDLVQVYDFELAHDLGLVDENNQIIDDAASDVPNAPVLDAAAAVQSTNPTPTDDSDAGGNETKE